MNNGRWGGQSNELTNNNNLMLSLKFIKLLLKIDISLNKLVFIPIFPIDCVTKSNKKTNIPIFGIIVSQIVTIVGLAS